MRQPHLGRFSIIYFRGLGLGLGLGLGFGLGLELGFGLGLVLCYGHGKFRVRVRIRGRVWVRVVNTFGVMVMVKRHLCSIRTHLVLRMSKIENSQLCLFNAFN